MLGEAFICSHGGESDTMSERAQQTGSVTGTTDEAGSALKVLLAEGLQV
jgi:hypothetical protein